MTRSNTKSNAAINPNTIIGGKTILEWLENKQLISYAGWPCAIQSLAVDKRLGPAPFFMMHKNGNWAKHSQDLHVSKLNPGCVYKLRPGYDLYRPLAPQGSYEEYVVDEEGNFHLPANDLIYDWADACILGGEVTFAGFVWEHNGKRVISQLRYGVDHHGDMSSLPDQWAYPLAPVAVRFWVVN